MIDRDRSIKSLLDYQELVKLQTRKISDLAYALYTEQDESVKALTNSFAIDNVEIYLKLKRLVYDKRKKRPVLHPENSSMKDISPDEIVVQGVAVKVIKDLP